MVEDTPSPLQEYFLRPGYIYVPMSPTLISTVLGSCVAVCIWDPVREYGGMNHFLYPFTRNPEQATAQYGNVATQALIRFLVDEGSEARHLEAQIFGGAASPESLPRAAQVGRENVLVAKRVLEKGGIRIASEDVGGSKGRKLVYNSHTNEVLVIRVETLRRGDWYPYEARR